MKEKYSVSARYFTNNSKSNQIHHAAKRDPKVYQAHHQEALTASIPNTLFSPVRTIRFPRTIPLIKVHNAICVNSYNAPQNEK